MAECIWWVFLLTLKCCLKTFYRWAYVTATLKRFLDTFYRWAHVLVFEEVLFLDIWQASISTALTLTGFSSFLLIRSECYQHAFDTFYYVVVAQAHLSPRTFNSIKHACWAPRDKSLTFDRSQSRRDKQNVLLSNDAFCSSDNKNVLSTRANTTEMIYSNGITAASSLQATNWIWRECEWWQKSARVWIFISSALDFY